MYMSITNAPLALCLTHSMYCQNPVKHVNNYYHYGFIFIRKMNVCNLGGLKTGQQLWLLSGEDKPMVLERCSVVQKVVARLFSGVDGSRAVEQVGGAWLLSSAVEHS